jgi:hypothetical protein
MGLSRVRDGALARMELAKEARVVPILSESLMGSRSKQWFELPLDQFRVLRTQLKAFLVAGATVLHGWRLPFFSAEEEV